MADVVNLRFLVETLATRLAAVTASDEIEVLNTQVKMLQESSRSTELLGRLGVG